MKVILDCHFNKIYIVEDLRWSSTSTLVGYKGVNIRGGRITGGRKISLAKERVKDVTDFFNNPEEITLHEARMFAMLNPGVKLFNKKTGEIYVT